MTDRTKAMDDLIAQDADLIEFMASDAACYLYPGEHQQAERAAYAKGCAQAATQLQALAARVKVLEAENERLRQQLSAIGLHMKVDPSAIYPQSGGASARAALGEKQ